MERQDRPTVDTYRVDTDQVSYRLLDGEAVVIHLGTSVYYGLNRTATTIWERLASAPAGVDDLVTGFAAGNDIDLDVARHDVEGLVTQLAAEGLVVSATGGGDTAGAGSAWTATGDRYVAPQLERYDKLEQLMLSGE